MKYNKSMANWSALKLVAILMVVASPAFAQICLTYVPKECQAFNPPPFPATCFYTSTSSCSTRGDCTCCADSGAAWPLSTTSSQSCSYSKTIVFACVTVYSGTTTCWSQDLDCAPVSCGN